MLMHDISAFAAARRVTPAAGSARGTAPARGLLPGALVETQSGWRPVESLRAGDRVHSWDGGLVRLLALGRDWLVPGAPGGLIDIPGGVLSACTTLTLAAGQHLLVEDAPQAAGDAAGPVLLPAWAFAGLGGVTRRAVTRITPLLTPVFACDEVIFANTGVLLHCPGIDSRAPDATPARGPRQTPAADACADADADAAGFFARARGGQAAALAAQVLGAAA